MSQTAERGYGPEHWGSDYQSKIVDGAPEQLTLEMNLYQSCMEQHAQQETDKLDYGPEQPKTEELTALANRCAQSLAKLSRQASTETANGDELVAFEVYHGESINIAGIGYWLNYHRVGQDFQYNIIAYTPRWVYDMMRKALKHEQTILSRWPGEQIPSRIGDAYPVRSIKDIVEANTLWDPVLQHGAYQNYRDALHAVQIL